MSDSLSAPSGSKKPRKTASFCRTAGPTLRVSTTAATGLMSPTASIRVGLVIPLANSISISVASGTSGSNPLSSSGESANLGPCSQQVRPHRPHRLVHRKYQIVTFGGNLLRLLATCADHLQQSRSFAVPLMRSLAPGPVGAITQPGIGVGPTVLTRPQDFGFGRAPFQR
jgi:hypothetical protein